MESMADSALPQGFGYEWTGLAYQEKAAGGSSGLIFVLAVVFVFLVLAALYESVALPLAVVLIVPMCILAAMIGINLRGMENNILNVLSHGEGVKKCPVLKENADLPSNRGEGSFRKHADIGAVHCHRTGERTH